MRVFHADAVEAVDVILEPFKVGEGRVIAGARDFEEGPARSGWARAAVHPSRAIRHPFVEGGKLCRNHANRRGARNLLHTQISFLLFIPHCRGDFSQIDLLSEG